MYPLLSVEEKWMALTSDLAEFFTVRARAFVPTGGANFSSSTVWVKYGDYHCLLTTPASNHASISCSFDNNDDTTKAL